MASRPTTEEKYEWLCENLLKLADINMFECDAMLIMQDLSRYIQFSGEPSVDQAIEYLMSSKTHGAGV